MQCSAVQDHPPSPHLPLLCKEAHELRDRPVLEQVALQCDAARIGCMQLHIADKEVREVGQGAAFVTRWV